MKILVRVPAQRLRRWHTDFARRLAAHLPAEVVPLAVPSSGPASTACELLIELERLVLRRLSASGADRIDVPSAAAVNAAGADLVIDLTGDEPPPAVGTRLWRPLFDGRAREEELFAVLLDGRMPELAIEDVGTGQILATGLASAESAQGFGGMIEECAARIATLVGSALGDDRPRAARMSGPAPRLRAARAARFALRNLAVTAARALYRLCCFAPHWRIGWRGNDGPGVWEREDLGGPAWHVLADPGHRFFADPVPAVWQGRTVLFFEDLDHRVGKGIISAIEFDGRGPCGAVRPVLEEPWHLSYPFIFPYAGTLWMIPESSARREIVLYRMVSFPWRWERAATLVSGIEASDATIVEHDGRLFMFAATRDGAGAWSDCLSIFIAPTLLGPWTPHARNPVLVDAASARPAGNMLRRGGRLLRPVQDCRHGYGTALGLAEIRKLHENDFAQSVQKVLRPGPEWPGRKLHTLNRAGGFEFIDGAITMPKSRTMRGFAEAWYTPAATLAGAPQVAEAS